MSMENIEKIVLKYNLDCWKWKKEKRKIEGNKNFNSATHDTRLSK